MSNKMLALLLPYSGFGLFASGVGLTRWNLGASDGPILVRIVLGIVSFVHLVVVGVYLARGE